MRFRRVQVLKHLDSKQNLRRQERVPFGSRRI
jgi:hypothetical protein